MNLPEEPNPDGLPQALTNALTNSPSALPAPRELVESDVPYIDKPLMEWLVREYPLCNPTVFESLVDIQRNAGEVAVVLRLQALYDKQEE